MENINDKKYIIYKITNFSYFCTLFDTFTDREWRLYATTIEKVIKKIVKLKSLSPKQIKLINEIFQYSK